MAVNSEKEPIWAENSEKEPNLLSIQRKSQNTRQFKDDAIFLKTQKGNDNDLVHFISGRAISNRLGVAAL